MPKTVLKGVGYAVAVAAASGANVAALAYFGDTLAPRFTEAGVAVRDGDGSVLAAVALAALCGVAFLLRREIAASTPLRRGAFAGAVALVGAANLAALAVAGPSVGAALAEASDAVRDATPAGVLLLCAMLAWPLAAGVASRLAARTPPSH